MHSNINAIVFDLGGVLVELNHQKDTVPWFNNELSAETNWHQWLTSPLSQQFERGQISPSEFAQRYIRDNDIQMESSEFLEHFRSWVVGFYPGAFSLLKQLSQHYPIAVFSNVTAVHWLPLYAQMKDSGSVSYFFASYELGMAKPDPAAFEHVANTMGLDPEEILFVDDNPINVEGARLSGFQGEIVSGFDQLAPALTRHSINLGS
jgi:putative hydrolase of the HAD superfamily